MQKSQSSTNLTGFKNLLGLLGGTTLFKNFVPLCLRGKPKTNKKTLINQSYVTSVKITIFEIRSSKLTLL